jgi:nucleoside 2-deoxyribosyltransferase
MQTRVFLSGAIEDVQSDFKYSWRDEATSLLDNRGFKAVNPLDYALEEENCEPKEIVDKNLFLQKSCDIILVEYRLLYRAYIGTDFEMTWAHLNNQPIIVWAHQDLQHRIYLKFLATKLADTLEEAVEYICNTYPSNK